MSARQAPTVGPATPGAGDDLVSLARPDRAAVLVIDMQNDDCKTGGVWVRLGDNSWMDGIVAKMCSVIESARLHGVPVIWIKTVWRRGPGYRGLPAAYLRFLFHKCGFRPGERAIEEDSWGAEII